MENGLRRQVLFIVLIKTVCIILCYAKGSYYVKPANDGRCPGLPCHTIEYYLQYQWSLQFDSSTIYFLQGVHTITTHGAFRLNQVNNLALVGLMWQASTSNSSVPTKSLYNTPAVIDCTDQNGFQFTYSTSITIANITFIHCGVRMDVDVRAAVAFEESSNINVTGVIIQNSTGYGLWMYNVLGNSSISQSRFISNKGNAIFRGGNMYMKYSLTEKYCNLETVIFSIQSSQLRGGKTLIPNYSAGFDIQIQNYCNHLFINLNKVVLSGNNGGLHDITSTGGNLNIFILEPKYAIGYTQMSIRNSRIEKGISANGGGIAYLVASRYPCNTSINLPINKLEILNTSVIRNMAEYAGGFMADIQSVCQIYNIELKEVDFWGNQAENQFSSMSALIETTATSPAFFIGVDSCTFQSGAAAGGGFGIFLHHTIESSESANILHQNPGPVIFISNTWFINNTGGGGAFTIVVQGITSHLSEIQDYIKVQNCTFTNNSGTAGSSLFISTSEKIFVYSLMPYQVHILFENVLFHADQILSPNTAGSKIIVPIIGDHFYPARRVYSDEEFVIFIYSTPNVAFSNCKFTNNQMTPIVAQSSKIYLSGSLTFFNNTGLNGGAIAAYDSYLLPKPHTRMYFHNNRAILKGGALYVKRLEIPLGLVSSKCFLQPSIYPNSSDESTNIVAYFVNNMAGEAGDILYGGYINQCYIDFNKTSLFRYISFNYTLQTGSSIIASDPIGVCFCDSGQPNCSKKLIVREVFPGDSINIFVVAVGQGGGIVPGVVRAVFKEMDFKQLKDLELSQSTTQNCTSLTYTIFSRREKEQLQLTAENPGLTYTGYRIPPLINISLLPCPLGFNLSGIPHKCDCVSLLAKKGYSCNISTQTIHRPVGTWLGYSKPSPENSTIGSSNIKSGIILHNHCPLDYCKHQDSDLNLLYPDSQCELNHSGLLCGECQLGLSLALGTSQCLKCSNLFLVLLLAFALAGLALVVLLSWCNLTVSEGTLSALILYANIIQVSRSAYLPQSENNVLTVVVAWLNLDLGIETCFYNGMDMYAKAWLQLVFPLYIWTIVAAMIVLSRYYTTAARLVGQNAPKVLATLFLISYAKLLRVVITILSFTYVEYPDGHSYPVWLYDANVAYVKGKHIPLFIAAVFTLIVFLIPYTFVVLCMQWLRRKSAYKLLAWVRRLKPVFDPYGGPYKDMYQFWTGLLLVVRVFLFLAIAFNSSGSPALTLLLTGIAAVSLLCTLVAFRGVYKSQILDILEASFLMNISVLVAATLYAQLINRNLAIPIRISMGISLITFIMILLYHIHKRVPVRFLKGFSTRLGKNVHNPTTTESDVEYREIEQQPLHPQNPVHLQRLTLGEDGEMLLVTDH